MSPGNPATSVASCLAGLRGGPVTTQDMQRVRTRRQHTHQLSQQARAFAACCGNAHETSSAILEALGSRTSLLVAHEWKTLRRLARGRGGPKRFPVPHLGGRLKFGPHGAKFGRRRAQFCQFPVQFWPNLADSAPVRLAPLLLETLNTCAHECGAQEVWTPLWARR